MNPTLEDLVMLAAIDGEWLRHRQELAEAPRRVAAAEARDGAARAAVDANTGQLAAEEKLRRSQQSDVAGHRGKIARLRKNLDGATSSAQVSAFEHEIAFAEKAVAQLEDEELASMERTEGLEAEAIRLAAALKSAEQALTAERERSLTVTAAKKSAILGLDTERKKTRAGIDPDRLALYDRLTKSRGSAIAEAVGNNLSGKCGACQMGVRPQRWQDLIGREHSDEIFTCESCGRMLFWDLRRDSPQAWPPGDRWRAATTVTPGAPAR